jgi:hypothetical protein
MTGERYVLLATRGPHAGRYFGGFTYPGQVGARLIWVQAEEEASLLGEAQLEPMMLRIGPAAGLRPMTVAPPQPFDALPERKPVVSRRRSRAMVSKTVVNVAELEAAANV